MMMLTSLAWQIFDSANCHPLMAFCIFFEIVQNSLPALLLQLSRILIFCFELLNYSRATIRFRKADGHLPVIIEGKNDLFVFDHFIICSPEIKSLFYR